MKKIMTLFIALSVATLGAYAKTQAELVNEISAIKSGKDKATYVSENLADIATAFNAWKDTDEALLGYTDIFAIKDSTRDATIQRKRLFSLYADLEYENVGNLSDLFICKLHANALTLSKGENWYEGIKSDNWTVDGTELSLDDIYYLATLFQDDVYLLTRTFDEAKEAYFYTNKWINLKLQDLLAQSDLKTAYNESLEIETYLMKTNNQQLLLKAQKVQDAIYLRLTRANKIK